MTYDAWMYAVDTLVEARCGLPMELLPDWLSRDAYDNGLTVQQGVEACLQQTGFCEPA